MESLSPWFTVAEIADFSANSRRRFNVLGPTYASPSESTGRGLSEQETRMATRQKQSTARVNVTSAVLLLVYQ